jgi:hypothetical protein
MRDAFDFLPEAVPPYHRASALTPCALLQHVDQQRAKHHSADAAEGH